jgi:hypothetical protein
MVYGNQVINWHLEDKPEISTEEMKQILYSNVESLTRNDFSQCFEIQRLKLRKSLMD